jgi:tripartite ATP-independent transporter DctM subunit
MHSVLFGALLLILAAAGAPIFALIGGLGLALFHAEGIDASAVIIEMARLSEMPSLITIPLFTFAGYLLAESQAPSRLLELGEALFGWLPGGFAVAALCSCALFTAFTGASGVTIIALGGLIFPLLCRQKYPASFSLGLVTATGSLGLLFPPSLPIILYALVAGLSLNRLFAAAALPGIVLMLALILYATTTASRHHVRRAPFSAKTALKALRAAAWEIPLPFFIIGGIYSGSFTASEASAVMAFYVLFVEVLIYRDLKIRDIPNVIARSQILVGAILIVLGTALGLTNYFIDAQIPERLFSLLSAHMRNPWEFLACLNIFLLIVNMVEIFSAIIIMVPIIVPVALRYHIDPFHLGALFLLNLEIGYLTPPMGLNLFLSSRRFDKPLTTLYKASWPFWLIMIAILALVTYLPTLSLWLPKVLHIQ